jgi:hypothetical protein
MTALSPRTGSATKTFTLLVVTIPETPTQHLGKPKMAGENSHEAPTPSLRDIAEAAYDDLENAVEPQEGSDPEPEASPAEPLASDDRPRDKSGRWVAKSEAQTGETIARLPLPPIQPRSQEVSETRVPEPDPAAAQASRSNQVPEHWSAEEQGCLRQSCPRKDGPSF